MIAKALILGAVLASSAVSSAVAETKWEAKHPRQDQVLDRVHRQQLRITRERKEGELTAGQAKTLRAEDRSIAAQDRLAAHTNGGYITKTQQKALNQEENGVSKQIGH